MRKSVVVAAFAAALVALAACTSTQTTAGDSASPGDVDGSQAPASGGSAVFQFVTAPLDLDPATSQDNNVSMPMWNAWFEYLVTLREGELSPGLAASWTVSDDKLVYTFTLDPRAQFSNGSDLTAQDVVFSLNRDLAPDISLLHFLTDRIESISAPDPDTVQIALNSPWPHLLADMASPTAAIYSEAALKAAPSEKAFFNEAPIGTGPFTLASATANTSYTIARNDNYWDDSRAAKLDSIEWQVVPDDTARVTAVVGGRADIAQSPPANQLEGLKSNADVQVLAFPSARVEMWVLNTKKPPFDNLKVRQAFSLAIDRSAIISTGLFGYADVAQSFLVGPPELTFQNPALALYPTDMERAKQLIAESGVPTPINVTLLASTGAAQDAELTITTANLTEAGFSVSGSKKDAASVDNDIIGQTFQANTTFWGNQSADPSIQPLFTVDPAFCCDAYFTGYDDPALVAVAKEAINTADPSQAQPLWDKLQTDVAEAAFIVPLYYPQLTYLAGASIDGFKANSFGFYDWAAIGKKSS